jgi:RNA polymerase sigma-70 factor (ECF subfamily)
MTSRRTRTILAVSVSNPSATMLNARLAVTATADVGDAGLIARVAAGDRSAARSLYDRHVARVYRLAYRLCGDADLAQDLTQDVFIHVFARLDQFRGESAFTTWLHRVTVNTCLNSLRRVQRVRRREVDLELVVEHPIGNADRDPWLDVALDRAINALPEGLRVVAVMYAIEGYTHADIAAALGIAEGTSKSRLFDARALLRTALASQQEEYRDE